MRENISILNLKGELNIYNPILWNRWYRGAHLNPFYYTLIFPTVTLKSDEVEYMHHNRLGFYTSKYTLNWLTRHGVILPTSLDYGYDAKWCILWKDQDMKEIYPTLWVKYRVETSTTLLSRDPSTPSSLHVNSSPWDIKQGGRVGSMFSISHALYRLETYRPAHIW